MLCVVALVLHKYVPPPAEGVAVSVAVEPEQTVALFTLIVGNAFVVTVAATEGLLQLFKVYTAE